MLVFIDFEASSLAKKSYPIEVGWVFEDGRSHECLIRPAPDWTDWDPAAEAIHHIARDTLVADGTPHDVVAAKMVADLSGHDLVASAPSWDGKWLSALLRAAGIDRRSLRLRASEDARRETATAILAPHVPAGALTDRVEDVLTLAQIREPAHVPAHRALADAQEERGRWCAVRTAALRAAERLQNDR